MSKVIDAPTESSPVAVDINEGFAEFQAEQRASRSAAVEEPPEDAPASEPEIPAGDEPATRRQEPLTDEQKSAMKRANNEKRWDKLLRERDEARAELERLKTPTKAEPAAPAPAASTAASIGDDPKDPRPRQDFNPKTGKPYTDFDEYVDDRSSWNARQVIRTENANREAAETERSAVESSNVFMDEVAEYAKTHPELIGSENDPGHLKIVGDELEDGLQEVSKAIFRHEKRVEIIDYLGSNPQILDSLLTHRGNPVDALIALGRITAHFDESATSAPSAPTATRRTLPKPASPVGGRGHAPSGEAALDAAAEANDFTAFQKTLRSRERRR